MKKTAFAALLSAALILSACARRDVPPVPGSQPQPTADADECPRADGQPCR